MMPSNVHNPYFPAIPYNYLEREKNRILSRIFFKIHLSVGERPLWMLDNVLIEELECQNRRYLERLANFYRQGEMVPAHRYRLFDIAKILARERQKENPPEIVTFLGEMAIGLMMHDSSMERRYLVFGITLCANDVREMVSGIQFLAERKLLTLEQRCDYNWLVNVVSHLSGLPSKPNFRMSDIAGTISKFSGLNSYGLLPIENDRDTSYSFLVTLLEQFNFCLRNNLSEYNRYDAASWLFHGLRNLYEQNNRAILSSETKERLAPRIVEYIKLCRENFVDELKEKKNRRVQYCFSERGLQRLSLLVCPPAYSGNQFVTFQPAPAVTEYRPRIDGQTPRPSYLR